MDEIAGSPYVQLTFDKNGALVGGAMADLAQALDAAGAEDLVVLSHGWKFEGEQPRQFYDALWGQVARALSRRTPARIVVAGVVWPSKFFTTGIDADTLRQAAAGGVQSVGAVDADGDLDPAAMAVAVEQAIDALDLAASDAAALRGSVTAYLDDQSDGNATALLEAIARGTRGAGADAELADEAGRLEETQNAAADTLLLFQDPPELTPDSAATLGLGDFLTGILSGPRAAVVRVLEQFSYYEMKRRAGVVGTRLAAELGSLAPARETRLHLVGHSFGARLVTACADAYRPPATLPLFSLTLLQGAFSHSALSRARGGGFAGVIGRTAGPIAISHTHNDWACTIMYALASRLSNTTTNALGDKDDVFGAMGANGAQFSGADTPARDGSLAAPFDPRSGSVNNFRADGYIKDEDDAHNDVRNPTVGELVAACIEAA